MIVLDYVGHTFTTSGKKRLKAQVEKLMEKDGTSGHSASGLSALMAIEWCERHDRTWTLTHVPGGGYVVEAR